jgi:tetratricopeptide (TPR) repeat protein
MVIPALCSGVLVIALALPAIAQNRVVKGKVTNDKDEPVVGAQVLIQGTDVKREYTVKTDKKGEYFYMGIPFGVYRVVVRAQGYQPDYAQGIKPSIAQESDVNFKLTPGADRKLAFELSPEELTKMKQEAGQAEKQKAASAEVKTIFEAALELAKQGKYAEAIVEYKKALEKDAQQPYILANMADAMGRANQLNEAYETYQKAIALKADDAALYTNMGVLLGRMGKTAESQAAFKKAAEINPGAAAQNFYNLGATLVNSGRAADAAEAFKQSIAADPNFAEAYYQLGICLSGSPATIPDALKALEKYTEIGKNAEQVEVAKQLMLAFGPKDQPKGKDTKKKN